MVLVISAFFLISSCTQKIQEYIWRQAQEVSYETPFQFSNFPATLLLKNGDTVTGQFSFFQSFFNLMHAIPDSNRVWGDPRHASYREIYYKRYYATELIAYIINGDRFEAVYPTSQKVRPGEKIYVARYEYMKELTTENSKMKLYRHLYEDKDETSLSSLSPLSTLFSLLSRVDTTIGHHDFLYHYYLRFPDDPPDYAWRIDTRFFMVNGIMDKFRENFGACPTLAETLRKLESVSNSKYVILQLVEPDSEVQSRGIPAILERIRLFEDCLERKKTKFQAPISKFQ